MLLTTALGGTFTEALVPFEEPRALNYGMIVAAAVGLLLSHLWRRPMPPSSNRLLATSPMSGLLAATTIFIGVWGMATIDDPARLAKLLLFVLVTLPLALWTARLLEPAELVSTLFVTLLLINIVSLILVLVAPAIGTMDFVRGVAWSGIYGQKNALGRQATLLGLFSLLIILSAPSRAFRLLAVAGLVLAVVVAIASLSRTAQGLLLLGVALVLILALMPRQGRLLIGLALLAALFSLQHLSLSNITMFEVSPFGLILADHSIDLTGRLPVWDFAWWLFEQHPVFGAGFDALWSYEGGSARYQYLGWRVTDSHNGFLDLLVQAGLVGAVLYGAAMLIILARATRIALARRPKTVLEALFVVFAVLTGIVNLTSSQITEVLSLWNFLFLVVCFASDRPGTRPRSVTGTVQCHSSASSSRAETDISSYSGPSIQFGPRPSPPAR